MYDNCTLAAKNLLTFQLGEGFRLPSERRWWPCKSRRSSPYAQNAEPVQKSKCSGLRTAPWPSGSGKGRKRSHSQEARGTTSSDM